MQLGWGKDNPGPKSYAAVMSNVETVLRGLAAGVDGFNRWSFVNRGDLDGQWQLVHTWDIAAQSYANEVRPEPVAYFGYAILTRFQAKHSALMPHQLQCPKAFKEGELLTATLRSPKGNLTTWILNKSGYPAPLQLRYSSGSLPGSLAVYQITEAKLRQPGFHLEAERELTPSTDNCQNLSCRPLQPEMMNLSYPHRH